MISCRAASISASKSHGVQNRQISTDSSSPNALKAKNEERSGKLFGKGMGILRPKKGEPSASLESKLEAMRQRATGKQTSWHDQRKANKHQARGQSGTRAKQAVTISGSTANTVSMKSKVRNLLRTLVACSPSHWSKLCNFIRTCSTLQLSNPAHTVPTNPIKPTLRSRAVRSQAEPSGKRRSSPPW